MGSDFASSTVSASRTFPYLGLHNGYSIKDIISVDMGDAGRKTSLHDNENHISVAQKLLFSLYTWESLSRGVHGLSLTAATGPICQFPAELIAPRCPEARGGQAEHRIRAQWPRWAPRNP